MGKHLYYVDRRIAARQSWQTALMAIEFGFENTLKGRHEFHIQDDIPPHFNGGSYRPTPYPVGNEEGIEEIRGLN